LRFLSVNDMAAILRSLAASRGRLTRDATVTLLPVLASPTQVRPATHQFALRLIVRGAAKLGHHPRAAFPGGQPFDKPTYRGIVGDQGVGLGQLFSGQRD